MRPWLRSVAGGLAPLVASWLPLYYIQVVHLHLIFGAARATAWAFVAAAPLLIFETAATGLLEARRQGWRPQVKAGLAGRCLFLTALAYLFFGMTLRAKGTPAIFTHWIGLWPGHALFCWRASPLPAACAGGLLILVYARLTIRRRLFRLSTTVLLPGLATLLLFGLFYFYPASPLRTWGERRPPAVERIFPHERYAGLDQALGGQRVFFGRDLAVPPDDSWVMASLGATYTGRVFGPGPNDQPNLIWADLRGARYRVFRGGAVHRFSSGCPDRIYFAPWNGARLFAYRPGADAPEPIDLPPEVLGRPVREIYSVCNDCRRGRVYIANNLNPALFVWDSVRRRLERTLPLAGVAGLEMGDNLWLVKRNPFKKTLLLLMFERYNIVELDEESLEPRKFVAFPKAADLPWSFETALDLALSAFIPLSPGTAMDLALSPDGRFLYAPSYYASGILKLDAETLAVVGRLPSPAMQCRRLEFSPDGRWLFAGSYMRGTVIVYDAAADRAVLSFYVTPKVEALFATKRYLYILGAEGIFRVALDSIGDMVRDAPGRAR